MKHGLHRITALIVALILILPFLPAQAALGEEDGGEFRSFYSDSVSLEGVNLVPFALNDLLTGAVLLDAEGNVLSNGSHWTILPNQQYKIKFNFREENGNPDKQFLDDDTPMPFLLPEGLELGDESTDGSIEIDMGEDGKAHATYAYDPATRTVNVVWNTDEPTFEKLKTMGNAEFEMTFDVFFTGEESSVSFSDSVTVTFQDYHLAQIEKTGVYDRENGRINYTVTVTNVGRSDNVTVGDVLDGAILSYRAGDRVSWTSSLGADGSNGVYVITDRDVENKRWSLALGSLSDGEVVTLQYASDIDYGAMTHEVDNIYARTSRYESTEEETKNTATVNADGQDPLSESWHTLDIYTQTLRKTGTVSESAENGNQRIIHWTLEVNEDVATSLAGKTLRDTLSKDTSGITSFDQSVPLAIQVYDAAGNLVETREIDWQNPPANFTFRESASNSAQDQWRYTVPDTDGVYRYVITYDTLVDVTGLTGDPSIRNGLEIVNENGVWSSATVPAGTSKFDYAKALNTAAEDTNGRGWNGDYIYWKITLSVPAVGTNTAAYLDEYLPLVSYNGGYLYDEIDEESIAIDGLLEGESYTLEPMQTGVDRFVRFTFYQDEAQQKPGFQAFNEARTVTVTFRTINDPTWMEVYPNWRGHYPRSIHKNVCKLFVNNAYNGNKQAEAIPYKVRPVKDGTYVATANVNGVSYPVYRYTVDFQGVADIMSQDRILSVDGVHRQRYFKAYEHFDTDTLRLLDVTDAGDYAILEAVGADMARVNRLICLNGSGASDIARYPASWDPDGCVFTFCYDEQVPTNGGRGTQSNYFMTYYMIVKDEAALSALERRAVASGYAVSLSNTVSYASNGASSTATVPFTYNPINKELTDYDPATRTATFRIVANAARETLNGGNPMTLTDAYSSRLAVDFSTVSVTTDPAEARSGVSWNYQDNVGTFTVPDATRITLTYRAVVLGEDDEVVAFSNTATLAGHHATIQESRTLKSMGSGSASNPKARVFKFESGDMSKALPNAVFQLYRATAWSEDSGRVSAGEPMTFHTSGTSDASYALKDGEYTHAHAAGDAIYFITDDNGYATVQLYQNTDGLTLEKGVRYYLREVRAPQGFRLSDVNWSFQIEDVPDYSRLIYYNNDILTVADEPISGVEVVISGKKILRGRAMKAGEFSFTLTPVDADGRALEDGEVLTAACAQGDNGEATTFAFEALVYDMAAYSNASYRDDDGNALFYYLVEESIPAGATNRSKDGVTYSTDRFLVTVTLSYHEETLSAGWKASVYNGGAQ